MGWYIFIFLLGAGVFALMLQLRSRSIEIKWYDWLISLVGLSLLLFTIQNFFASLAEYTSTAAWMFLLVTGLPAVILMAISWQLVARRAKAS